MGSDTQILIKELKETNNELNKNNEQLIMENAELNEKKNKMEEVMAKIEEMEKENVRLQNENQSDEYVDIQKEEQLEATKSSDEYVDIGKESENENEEYVNVKTVGDGDDNNMDEKQKDVEPKQKGKKVHKLAMGLNIPMGGMKGGTHPLLAKKKKDRLQSGENRELPQQNFSKPLIPSDQRSPKKRPAIAPLLDDDLKTDLND